MNISIAKLHRRDVWEQFIANDSEKPIHLQLFKTLHEHRNELEETIAKEDREKIMSMKMTTEVITELMSENDGDKEKATGRDIADVLFEICCKVTMLNDDRATAVEIPLYLTKSEVSKTLSVICSHY